jgi:hypothetical protein
MLLQVFKVSFQKIHMRPKYTYEALGFEYSSCIYIFSPEYSYYISRGSCLGRGSFEEVHLLPEARGCQANLNSTLQTTRIVESSRDQVSRYYIQLIITFHTP